MSENSVHIGGLSIFLHPVAFLRSFHRRSAELEHIDKGDYTAQEYEGCMVELRRVNRYLGDTAILRNLLSEEESRHPLGDFSIVDIGAGTGELLRTAARWASINNRKSHLIGLELNARSAQGILQESSEFAEIKSVRGDALQLPFANNSFDFAICSLFTHHFNNDQVIRVLGEMSRVARRRVFVIDLYRHPLAYFLYSTVGHLFLHNRLLREDGALSILKSFRPEELIELAEQAQMTNVKVERRFPFRLVLSSSGLSTEATA